MLGCGPVLVEDHGSWALKFSILYLTETGEDIPEVQPRVPQHQILLEISNMIRQQMRSMVADDLLEQIPGMEGRGPSPVSGFMRPLPPVTR